MKRLIATVTLTVIAAILALSPLAAGADENVAVGVAIYFEEAGGSIKPYLFHDPANPLPRWSCEARLDYLTRMFYRISRSNPDLKGKTAVRSTCATVEGFDFSSQ